MYTGPQKTPYIVYHRFWQFAMDFIAKEGRRRCLVLGSAGGMALSSRRAALSRFYAVEFLQDLWESSGKVTSDIINNIIIKEIL